MPKAIHIDRGVYAISETGKDSAELKMYGEIVAKRPVDFWTDEPVEGDFIVGDEFLKDLESIAHVKSLSIRLNSLGGDAYVSMLIHNRLRELVANGTELKCTVDGCAMSGGSLIMSACDDVTVNPSSLIMVHNCFVTLIGGYNAEDLEKATEQCRAVDAAQNEIYQRKTGLSKTVIDHMMSETTYMTGREALNKGFADHIIEDAQALDIAASADRHTLFVNGKAMHIPGVALPNSIPVQAKTAPDTTGADSNNQPVQPGKEGGNPMTLDELRAQYPELIAEAEGSGAVSAAQAERDRLSAIDEVASLFPADLVQAAKYGDHPMTAQDLAYQAAIQAAQTGRNFLRDMDVDNKASGANDVAPAPAPQESEPASIEADVKAMMEMYEKTKKEAR